MKMQIRPYNVSDRGVCMRIFSSNVPQYFLPSELPDFEFFLNSLEQNTLAKHENEFYFVAEMEDKLIACAGVYYLPEEKTGGFAWGMVDRDHHRKGIGKYFTEFRISFLKEHFPQIQQIKLDTSQFTCAFFEKFGFQTKKVKENGYGPGYHRYDMLLNLK